MYIELDTFTDEEIEDYIDRQLAWWIQMRELYPEDWYYECDSPFRNKVHGSLFIDRAVPYYTLEYEDRTEHWCYDCMQWLQKEQGTNVKPNNAKA